jgi:hypothetical protein
VGRITGDHEQQLLARLGNDPAWGALRARAKERLDAEFDRLAKALMRGDDVTREDVQFRRGFFAGIKFLLDSPTLEAKKLDRALAKEGDTGSA